MSHRWRDGGDFWRVYRGGTRGDSRGEQGRGIASGKWRESVGDRMPSWLTDKVLRLLLSGKDFYNPSNQCVVLVYILLTFRFYLKTTPQLITVKEECNSYLVFSRFTKNEKNNKLKSKFRSGH